MCTESLTPGLAVIHANRLENLRDLLVTWLGAHPLAPLENEVVLVQSNGMAQWLKLALAADDGLGICAALEVQLPARFLWRCYQAVLGEGVVPEISPFDKTDIAWRIYRHLPNLTGDVRFSALRGFLRQDEDGRKRYQLAQALADLFDQYQVYRADWLQDWQQREDQLRDAHGTARPLPEPQRWQAELWRTVVGDVGAGLQGLSRAGLHQQFLRQLQGLDEPVADLPRRIVVFGISSLPQQTLQALQALGRFTQILLCVHNPCRYYWADIIEHRQLLRHQWRRHADKLPPNLDPEQLQLHANPLLAAWGKQGRDYIGLLAEVDDPADYQHWFQRIDLFEDWVEATDSATLLQRLQQAILDLEPLPASEQRMAVAADASVHFHLAHSPQREVEILQDQLLAMLEGDDLQPRDIIVMLPDIDVYAPHIHAVFGRIARDDPRYLAYGVSDQRQRGRQPLLIALEYLLQLPQARCSVSEILDLLDVPALRQRFEIAAEQLPLLRQWITQANIRWGLNQQQRGEFGIPLAETQNSWQFGLRRLLLGYAVGNGAAWENIEPCAEVSGLDAVLLGPLSLLVETLEQYWQSLARPRPAAEWGDCFRQLMRDFFVAATDEDARLLDQLQQQLDDWEALCQRVELDQPLPLTVMREVWLEALDQPSLSQRFLAGRINFCTLMPMRSIPFQVVCLLGMNDGAFPRGSVRYSFDLMAGDNDYRPGDRSRRDDDRYLFLEALLAARRSLYISWIGSSINDNSSKPPSLLVGQLRDYLAGGWRLAGASADDELALLAALTTVHPLQAFSQRYFRNPDDPRWFSYAHEWCAAWSPPADVLDNTSQLLAIRLETPLNLSQLTNFLRYPVKAFFNQRLQVWLEPASMQDEDDESFACDALQAHRLGSELLQAALQENTASQATAAFAEVAARQQRSGVLPLAGFAQPSFNAYAEPARTAWRNAADLLQRWSIAIEHPVAIELTFQLHDAGELKLEDWLSDLRQDQTGAWAQLVFAPGNLLTQQRLKYHNLLRPWLRHLAAAASGIELTTWQIGADVTVELPTLDAKQARNLLQTILEAWWQGMRQPLPLACKTAFAWLDSEIEIADVLAEKLYQGSEFQAGEVDGDAYLARQFPEYRLLVADGQFKSWLERLYRPLWQHAVIKDSI